MDREQALDAAPDHDAVWPLVSSAARKLVSQAFSTCGSRYSNLLRYMANEGAFMVAVLAGSQCSRHQPGPVLNQLAGLGRDALPATISQLDQALHGKGLTQVGIRGIL